MSEKINPEDEIKKTLKTSTKILSWPLRSIVLPNAGKHLPVGTVRRNLYEFGKKQGWWK